MSSFLEHSSILSISISLLYSWKIDFHLARIIIQVFKDRWKLRMKSEKRGTVIKGRNKMERGRQAPPNRRCVCVYCFNCPLFWNNLSKSIYIIKKKGQLYSLSPLRFDSRSESFPIIYKNKKEMDSRFARISYFLFDTEEKLKGCE